MTPGRSRSGRSLGQHFTPAPVAGFLWDQVKLLLGPEGDLPTVLDPAAGEGALLEAPVAEGANCVGIELDPAVAVAGRHLGVRAGDGLFDPVVMQDVDVVLANPPYGRASDLLTSQQWEHLLSGVPASRIWGKDGGPQPHQFFRSRPLEQLFVAQCLRLVRPGGIVGLILPDGLLANRRAQSVRDWILKMGRVRLIVALPAATFRRPGLNAMAHLVILQRHVQDLAEATVGGATPECLIVHRPSIRQARLPQALNTIRDQLDHARAGSDVTEVVRLNPHDLIENRWDAPYWHGRRAMPPWPSHLPLAGLGDFIEHITYGPIVTGSTPEYEPGGIPVVRQGDFSDSGLVLDGALRVKRGGAHDPERSRVATRDLLLPRSGAGALGRNRIGVYLGSEAANIGCFVDRIRLHSINPFYVWLYLRSPLGWGQIQAVINGVGTPNISFAEIRSLQIPVLANGEQDCCEEDYRREVLPLHEGGRREAAARAFARLVGQLESMLAHPSKEG